MLKKFLSNKNNKIILMILSFVLIVGILGFTLSELLTEDDVRVKPQSELTYYLDISYDGIDKDKVSSDDNTSSDIYSDVIYVEDKLPEGLTFKEFVTTGDGSIGAVYRNDKDFACPGRVIDDGVENENNYHGLHYDDETRTVSFKVKGLKAGCVLTVGIKTITPAIDDSDTPEEETRRDFYNYASASEDDLTVHSNTVHVWMGKESTIVYKVTYKYDGVVPSNAPPVPVESSYASGTTVGVASNPIVEGYQFSGWTTGDADVTEGKFEMPEKDVTFVGHFTKKESYNVTYSIEGPKPDGYVEPSQKSYYEGQNVKIDSLKEGSVFNGYRFKGWHIKTEGVTVTEDNDFTMPAQDVEIVGSFELVTYKVEYRFMGDILPEEPNQYLPDTKSYTPSSTVNLANVKGEPPGFKFLGWYYDDPFIMPEEDVVIYGEWQRQEGKFVPTIKKEVTSNKDYYHKGDIVTYDITVTNTASFAIKNVIIKEDNPKAKFINGEGYQVNSDHVVTINQMAPQESITIKAQYEVTESDFGTIVNTVKIIGALAGDEEHKYYVLDPDGNYESSAEFTVQSQLKVCKRLDGAETGRTFMIKIVSDDGFITWVRLKKDECQTIYVDPNATYTVTEVIPQEYSLEKIDITSNNGDSKEVTNGASFKVDVGINYEITITNKFKKKGFFHSFGEVVNKITGAS